MRISFAQGECVWLMILNRTVAPGNLVPCYKLCATVAAATGGAMHALAADPDNAHSSDHC